MFKRRGRILLLAGLIPLVLAGLVYAQQTPAPLAATRLPDGRVLTLNGVTHGHGTQYWYGGTRWQRWVGDHIHPGTARLLGLNPWAYSAHPVGQDPDQLLFWAKITDKDHTTRPNAPSPYYLRALLLDDDDCPYPQHTSGEYPVAGGWREHFQWSIWPHRSGMLRVRLFVQKSAREELGAPAVEWVVPNPAPAAVALNSGPVPAEAEAGPLHVVLTRLERMPPPSAGPPDPFAPQDGLRAVFRISENGRPAPDWRLSEVVLTDPTGNIYSWGKGPAAHYTVTPRGELVAECYGTVPPHEQVCRLTVRLVQPAYLKREAKVSGLPLPWAGPSTLNLKQSTVIRGETVHFKRVTRVDRPGRATLFNVEFATDRPSPGAFSVVKAYDQSGAPLKIGRGDWSSLGSGFAGLDAPPTSHTVTLHVRTFAADPPAPQAEMIIRIPQSPPSSP